MPVEDQNKQRNAELVLWKSLCKTMSFEILSQIAAHFIISQKIKVFLKMLCKFLFEKMQLSILVLASIELQVFDL